MLELNLFGAPRAHYGERQLAGFPGQQAYHLLCYLLLNRQRPHPREKLAAVFWGDYTTRDSRKYLRHCLWRVRQNLQSVGAPADVYLDINNHTVAFRSLCPHRLDVEEFETGVLGCKYIPGELLTPEQVTGLEKALALYTGELMEGVYVDWCIYDRERLALLHLDTLSKLMVCHESNGEYERGLACGERILAYDETREKVHRLMMRMYGALGNRQAALAQYKLCAQILHELFGISPQVETNQLYKELLRCELHTPDRAHRRAVPGHAQRLTPSSVLTARQIMERVHSLQDVIEKASAELRDLERLVTEELLGREG